MDKTIREHFDKMNTLMNDLEYKKSKAQAEDAYYYHVDRVRDFQHERAIHLAVTFFFSGLLLLSIVGLLWTASSDLSSPILIALFGGAGVILFVTVLFYVRHYYRLENGVQKLYTITERLRAIISN